MDTRLRQLLAMTSEPEFLKCYNQIKMGYAEVIKHVDTAVTLEEEEQISDAIRSYSKCIEAVDLIFAIPVGLPNDVDNVKTQWQDACKIIQRLKSLRSEVIYRRSCLKTKIKATDTNQAEVTPEAETINSETQQQTTATTSTTKMSPCLGPKNVSPFAIPNDSGVPMTYRQIIKGLRTAIATEDTPIKFDIVFESHAKLYKIQASGAVTSIEGGTHLSVALLTTTAAEWKYLNNIYFIHCQMATIGEQQGSGELSWVYPLIPGITTCFRTEYGAYILPDMEAEELGSAFGIIFDGQEPEYHKYIQDLIEAIIAGEVLVMTDFVVQGPDMGTTVSKTIVGTANFIATNLVKGAEKTGKLMVQTTPYIISRMSQAPPDTPPVSSAVQTSVEVAKSVTGVAVGVSGYIAGKVGSATMALGRFLAPHIRTQGANILTKGFGMDEHNAQEKMQGALTIAAGAVQGFSTVVKGLEESAKILGTNLSNNSVKIIEHKYGPSAGLVASGTFESLGNAFIVSQNVSYFTPKGIARRLAKSTGKGVVEVCENGSPAESQYVPAGVLYPDLSELREQYSK